MAVRNVSKYNFLAEPDNALVCGICLEVAEEPRQHEKCGKLFCSECLEKYGRKRPCPNCREENPQYFGDSKSKREIKALGVRCSHVDRGCQWEGTIGTLKQHMDTCMFAPVPCPKKCKDRRNKVKHFMRRDLDKHLEKDCPNRYHACQYCGEKGMYATITKMHDKICKKKILPCSNAECTQTMERQQITEHVRTQCPYTVISCKYKGIGCTSQLKRRDMATHEEDDKLHLHMSIDTVNTLQDMVDTLQAKCLTESTIFAVPGYQEKKAARAVFTSPSFYTHPYGYHMAVTVHWDTTFISFNAQILKGPYDTALKWPFRGKVIIKLLNQLQDMNHHSYTRNITNGCVGNNIMGFMGKSLFPHYALALDPVKNTQYLVDDTLYLRVDVEVVDHKSWLQCTVK